MSLPWVKRAMVELARVEEEMLKVIIFPLVLVALSLSACTTEQVYNSGQAWQHNQCNKLHDKSEFDRCVNRTDH